MSHFFFESFVILPDLSRVASGEEQMWARSFRSDPWVLTAEILHNIYGVPLKYGTGFAVEKFENILPQDFQDRYYVCLGLENRKATREDWVASLGDCPPSDQFVELFSCFKGKFVIGSALPPRFKSVLTALDIPWIDIVLHSVRYLENLMHSFSSNVPEIAALLERESIKQYYLEAAAANETARYVINIQHADFWLPENTALIVGRRNTIPGCDASGREFSFISAKEKLIELLGQYKRVFSVANISPEETKLLKSLGVICLPDPHYGKFRNHYMLLAHPSIKKVIGRTAEDGYEATLFGKTYEQWACPAPRQDTAWPIYEKPFTAAFWHAVVAAFAQPRVDAPAQNEQWPIPKLRLALRGEGDFDDCTSFGHAMAIGTLEKNVKAVQRAIIEKPLMEEWLTRHNEEHASASTQRVTHLTAGKTSDHAIFCAGDDRVVIQAIVTLCSFRKNGVGNDLFYITNTEALSDESRNLLSQFNITPLHTRYADKFAIQYCATTPSAYNQFAGPALLAERGYPYSIGVQTDVLCLRHFDAAKVFATSNMIALTYNNKAFNRAGTYQNPSEVVERYAIDEGLFDTIRLVPAVVFFKNDQYVKCAVQDKLLEMYSALDKHKILQEEETVVNILLSQHPSWLTFLEQGYNCHTSYIFGDKMPYCLHYAWIDSKPWRSLSAEKNMTSPMPYYCKKLWHDAAQQILGTALYNQQMQRIMYYE